MARSGAENLGLLDPSGSYVPAAGAVAVVSLASLLLLTNPAQQELFRDISHQPSVEVQHTPDIRKGTTVPVTNAQDSGAAASPSVALPSYVRNVGLETQIGSGERSGFGAGVLYRDDTTGRESLLAPLVRPPLDILCVDIAQMCEASR